ncbi:MAG: LamG domain-containing protein, partial [Bacteroidales bacterium]|nr:LamG domain-containing protein [Bacteroidales bacterium]
MKKKLFYFLFLLLTGTVSLNAQINNALNFDGVDDHITTTYDPSGDFTYCAWINISDIDKENMIVGTCTEAWNGYWFEVSSGYLRQYGIGSTEGTILISENTWTHVAITYDGTNVVFYVNGQVDITVAKTITNTGGNLYIGNIGALLHAASHFEGSMEKLSLWNVARTQAEIQAEMCSELTGAETGLVAYYKFDQGIPEGDNTAITELTDFIGNYNGTFVNFLLNGTTSNFLSSFSINALASDQTTCDGTAVLDGNDPTPGTGVWQIISGSGVLDNSTNFDATISGIDPLSSTLLSWSIEYSGCTDDVVVTITNNQVVASASDQTTCDGTAVLDGNDP